MQATSINEVIQQLAAIIQQCTAKNSRLGYFAALYYKVTVNVKNGIVAGQFQNGPRMEKLDITFANRYLDAYALYQNGQSTTASWKLAFDTAQKSGPLVLQHLLLGMNAHINLDLGIATAEVMGDTPLEDIHNDFNAINAVISSLTYQVLAELGRVSPLLSLLGLHASNHNSVLIQFSIDNARDGAWCFAGELYAKAIADRNTYIADRDKNIEHLGESLVNQSGFLKFTVSLIHLFELKKPAAVLSVLNDNKRQYFTVGKNL